MRAANKKSTGDFVVAKSELLSWGKILEAGGTIAHSLGKGVAFFELISDILELIKKGVGPGKSPFDLCWESFMYYLGQKAKLLFKEIQQHSGWKDEEVYLFHMTVQGERSRCSLLCGTSI